MSRRQPIPYSKTIYRQRNLIERMFARLKNFRRIATRYDKLARNVMAGAMIAATVACWLNCVRSLAVGLNIGSGPLARA